MAKIEKIGNIQIVDNKEDKFFYFPMISMACTGAIPSDSAIHPMDPLGRRGFQLSGALPGDRRNP